MSLPYKLISRQSAHLPVIQPAAGKIAIFSCGTGAPYFSTDTGAALRAAEARHGVVGRAVGLGVHEVDHGLGGVKRPHGRRRGLGQQRRRSSRRSRG